VPGEDVTVADCLAGATIASRNGPDQQARRRAFLEARRCIARARLGGACGSCGRDLALREAVWRAGVYIASGNYWMTMLCQRCRPPSRRWFKAHPCDTCGRPVQIEFSQRRHKHVFCCDRCGARWHNQQRNQRTRQARERVCPICAQPFVGTRRDAATCSPKCRQKAYRLRLKSKSVRQEQPA
jgi:hypothetical protein